MEFYMKKDSSLKEDPQYSDELQHYGILGMKWGVRRYQNPDGSLTKAGEKRYNDGVKEFKKELKNDRNEARVLNNESAILGEAYARSRYSSQKADRKVEKANLKGNVNKQKKANLKKEISDKTQESLKQKYEDSIRKLEDHRNTMIGKYGENAVDQIPYRIDKKTGARIVDIDAGQKRRNNLLTYNNGFWFGLMGAPISVALVSDTEPSIAGARRFADEYKSVKAEVLKNNE